ncbi:organic hydroperoxide resistance protein [Pseudoroseicyclus tamaricis]|uniref:Organic hydroperoxide resistance protein n=1 Tax=Pseudoroseicyclus tamaricis TaxID=2705421 RepID=A0A6B2JX78_9RHOB|nr:organic hydroperoxide resistance protein [Pseudoroseicyclus tamaricis]NDV00844.1 organic hydroperoxide resistance protein [Pseudoroseicyclus tamaricis]
MPASKVVYSTSATATGGRDGRSATADGALDVKLVTPTEMGGSGGEGVNPEQLFATGYAACFLGALKAYARSKKVTVPEDATVTVTVGIGPREDKGFGLDVKIAAHLPGIDEETAQDLVAGAHHVCPYSDATRNSLVIEPTVA